MTCLLIELVILSAAKDLLFLCIGQTNMSNATVVSLLKNLATDFTDFTEY
jgi:hypothetical protein